MNEKRSNASLLDAKIEAAFREAAKKVIKQARETNTPVIVWENGCAKEVPGAQFDGDR